MSVLCKLPLRTPLQPFETADQLLDRYGEEAPLKAALSARKAIDDRDFEACRHWREVIDLLCAKGELGGCRP